MRWQPVQSQAGAKKKKKKQPIAASTGKNKKLQLKWEIQSLAKQLTTCGFKDLKSFEDAVVIPTVKFTSKAAEWEGKKAALHGPNRKLEKIYLHKSIQQTGPSYISEIQKLAQEKDIELVLDDKPTADEAWFGNSHTVLNDGKLYFPYTTDAARASTAKAKIEYLSYASRCLEGYLPNIEATEAHGNHYMRSRTSEIEAREEPGNFKIGDCYLEAGNIRPGIKSNGEAGVVVSSDAVYTSMLLLDSENKLAQERVTEIAKRIRREDSQLDKKIDETVEQLRNAEKLFKTKLLKEFQLNPAPVEAGTMSIINKYKLGERAQVEDRDKALEFLAKLELTKEFIAKDLELDLDQITFVSHPPKLHLDIAIKEHPRGGFLVHDDGLSIKVLEYLMNEVRLPDRYKNDLDLYLEKAKLRLKHDGKRFDQLATELETAGYKVVRVPGIFGKMKEGNELLNALISRECDPEVALYLNGTSFIDNEGKVIHVCNGSNNVPLNSAVMYLLCKAGIYDEVYLLGQAKTGGQYAKGETMANQGGGFGCINYERRLMA